MSLTKVLFYCDSWLPPPKPHSILLYNCYYGPIASLNSFRRASGVAKSRSASHRSDLLLQMLGEAPYAVAQYKHLEVDHPAIIIPIECF